MSSDDEKAAIQARIYDCIKQKEPGWQEASLELFLLKASEPPTPECEITVERVTRSEPPATPPVVYVPNTVTSEADTAAGPCTKAGSGVGSAATSSRYIKTSDENSLWVPDVGAIGRGFETGELLSISDTARRSGLYILGRSGSGKTELLKRMILSDIDRGHGVFFVDPHGDAIDDLITRLPSHRLQDVISIDPDFESDSFGINLLSCSNIASWREREATYNRAKAVFDKLWKNMPEELPWLQLIIEHTLPVFIYNPDYTLAEAPRFYKDADFRRYLLRNVTQDPEIVDFWQTYFHQKQADAAMTRVWTLLGRPPVRDIVSQQKSTIEFAKILEERRILFVKLSANLSVDTRKFIGTILISELLHAVRKRAEIAEGERHQFCIFVDEFQHFAASDDFATLINEARKFGIATTVAHQERFGQFADDRRLLGATDAAANKILFQLGGKDAQEQEVEFARKPPTETRLEEQYTLSQEPVRDLLQGHTNWQIREFVTKYLRHLQWGREDVREEMEGERLLRLGDLDDAALYGVDERVAGIAGPSYYEGQMRALERREQALLGAHGRTKKLLDLHETSRRLRVTIRGLNDFLTKTMEGGIVPGTEAFADFLIKLTSNVSAVPGQQAAVLDLYIALSYGAPAEPRTIPFDLARSQGLFSKEVAALTFQAEKKTEEERRKFQTSFIRQEEQQEAGWRLRRREQKIRDRQRAMEGKLTLVRQRSGRIRAGRTGTREDIICREDFIWYPANVYTWFIWLRYFPDIEKLLIPYRTAKFTKPWEYLMADGQAAKTIAKLDESLNLVKAWKVGFEKYMEFMRARVCRDLKDLLHRYQEGALVMFALADCAGKGGWRFGQDRDVSLSEFPGIEGKDPVEVWCLVENLRGLMRGALGEKTFTSIFIKYFNEYVGYSYDEFDERLNWAGFQTSIFRYPIYVDIKYREDVQSLEALLTKRWDWFVRYHPTVAEWWKKSSASVRYYLLCRAADRISFGDRYSSLPPAAFAPYEELVGALVSLSRDTKARAIEAEEKEEGGKREGKDRKGVRGESRAHILQPARNP